MKIAFPQKVVPKPIRASFPINPTKMDPNASKIKGKLIAKLGSCTPAIVDFGALTGPRKAKQTSLNE